jgi:branched-chain amino acid transport system permease protein
MDWKQVLLFALLGLGSGSLIAGISLGVVLTYRGSGIINLATGALAMMAGYAFWSLRTGTYGTRFGTTSAFVITLVVIVAIGVLIEAVAFRPLRMASPLAKLVSSLGVLLVAQATMLLAFGNTSKPQPSVLSTDSVSLFGVNVPINRFILSGIVITVAAVLAALYRWSRFGLATRASSENEVAAMLAGLATNRISLANTVLASVVAGGLGVLAGSITTLDTYILPLQVVPALAAALLARFTSFGIACLAGLTLGSAQQVLYYFSTQSWFPQDRGTGSPIPLPGVQDLLVFLVIVAAMFWRGASLPGRGELVEQRLPSVPRPGNLLRATVLALGAGVAALILLPYDFRQALINTLLGVVIALSLVVLTGFVGQVSVVQLALAGAAGFTISRLAVDHGIGFPLGPVIAAVGATLIGLLTAISALRVRGVSLAVVTLSAAVAIQQFGFVNSTWGGGSLGSPVPPPKIFGFDLSPHNGWHGVFGGEPSPIFGFLVLAVVVLLGLLVAKVRRGALGRQMLAVRSNERAAAAAGINVRNVKLAAFGLGSFIAGIAGALYAYNFGSVNAARFGTVTALGLIAFAYVGGITMITGALFAGLISAEGLFPHALDKWFGVSGNWTLLFGGVALILTLIQDPDGIAGSFQKQARARRALLARVERRLGRLPTGV